MRQPFVYQSNDGLPRRFSAVLLRLFAATAFSLAAIGLYGVLSLAVTARTQEVAIRMALGAEQGRVRWLVIGQGAALVAVGALVGLAGALASTRVLPHAAVRPRQPTR